MHSEYVDGLVLRPLMDAGYTAWRDGERLGIVRLVDGEVVAEGDPWVRAVLVRRFEADLRAAAITLTRCESSSQAPRVRSAGRSSGSCSMPVTKSAA